MNGCDGREKSEYQPNPFICIPLFHSDVTVLLNLQFQKMDISIFVSFFLFSSSLGLLVPTIFRATVTLIWTKLLSVYLN